MAGGVDEILELPDIARAVESASLVDGTKVNVIRQRGKIMISVPHGQRDAMDTVVKLQLSSSTIDPRS